MRILKNELCKIYLRISFLSVFLVFMAVNGILLYAHNPDEIIEAEAYRRLYGYMDQLSEEEQITYINEKYQALNEVMNPQEGKNIKSYKSKVVLQFSKDILVEWWLIQEIYNQMKELNNYPEYLQSIQDKADTSKEITIFNQKNSFAIRNEQKTAQDFQAAVKQQLYFTNSHAFIEATEFAATDILIIMLLFYVVSLLIIKEKENGFLAMARPLQKGRVPFLAGKIGVIFLTGCATTVIFWSENYLIAGCKYGFPELDSPLQSISGYIGSILQITQKEYFLLFLGTKIIIYFFIGIVFMFFSLKAKKAAFVYVYAVLFFGISFMIYEFIDGNSILQLFKYFNIIHWIRVSSIYKHYFNLNIFSYPVNMIHIFWGGQIIVLTVLIGISIYFFCTNEQAVTLENKHFREKKYNWFSRVGLYYQETYKIMIMQKGIIILFLFAGLQGYFHTQNTPYIDINEKYYIQYMEQLEGKVTKEKLEFIQKEKERLENYEKMYVEAVENYEKEKISESEFSAIEALVNENTKGKEAFARVMERVNYLKEYKKQTGKQPYFVYETGYDKLTGNSENEYRDDIFCAIQLLLVSIAMYSNFFPMEFSSGMICIISSCRRGYNDMVRKKLVLTLGISTVLFFISYAPFAIGVMGNYGLNSWEASIASIPSFSTSNPDMVFWCRLILLYIERYIVYLCVLLFIFAISIYLKNATKTMFIATLVLVGPLAIHMLGFRGVDYVSLNAFFSGNMLLNHMNSGALFLCLIPLAIGGISLKQIVNGFRH